MSAEILPALWNAIWCTWIELAPWLLIGAVMAGAMHVLLPAHLIQRQLSGPWGPLRAVLLGIPLPLCSCGVIPAALQLKKDGARDGSVLGFLIATPQTGVDSIFASASLLGWPFAWFKVVSALVMGLVGGYGLQYTESPPEDVTHSPDCGTEEDAQPSDFGARVRQAGSFIAELVDNLAGWLVIGVLISASLDVLVPKSLFASIAAWGSVSVTLAVLALSLPLYVCATASVPIAASLVSQGLPLGAALVFLMAGPATNVATMGALYRSVGRRALIWYLGTIVGGSVLLAYVLDQYLGWVPNLAMGHEHRNDASIWELVAAFLLAAWVFRSLVGRLVHRWRARRAAKAEGPSVEIWVKGLTCEGCVRGLSAKLNELSGVNDLQVDLESGRVKAFGSVSRHGLVQAVTAAGYEVLAHGPQGQHSNCGHAHHHHHH